MSYDLILYSFCMKFSLGAYPLYFAYFSLRCNKLLPTEKQEKKKKILDLIQLISIGQLRQGSSQPRSCQGQRKNKFFCFFSVRVYCTKRKRIQNTRGIPQVQNKHTSFSMN